MEKKKPLIIFIGNPLFKDDKIGLMIGEKLRESLLNIGYDVEIADKTGLNLVDYLEGREEVVIVDSITASGYQIGEIVELDIDSLSSYTIWSPHYIGVPEAFKIMEILELNPPKKLYILGIKVSDVYTISEELSEELQDKLDIIVEEIYHKILKLLKRL
ncbi:MAG: hydrogenase maturation protease [Candidatus Caldarchaeales archaeon]